MPRRADRRTAVARSEPAHRFSLDRTWLARIALALAVIGGLLLVAHMAQALFERGSKRIERFERAADGSPGSAPAARGGTPP